MTNLDAIGGYSMATQFDIDEGDDKSDRELVQQNAGSSQRTSSRRNVHARRLGEHRRFQ